MNKRYVFLLMIVFSMLSPLAFATDEMMQSSIGSQFNELQPFSHLSEGHWFAFVLSLLLWISLIYALYSIIKWLQSRNK